jgi:hypothetical protein
VNRLGLLLLLCLATVFINLPFGYYRAGTRRLSWQWFLAIHLPVPLIIIMRLVSGEGWSAVPLLIVCAVLGQLMGGSLKVALWKQRRAAEQIPANDDERQAG